MEFSSLPKGRIFFFLFLLPRIQRFSSSRQTSPFPPPSVMYAIPIGVLRNSKGGLGEEKKSGHSGLGHPFGGRQGIHQTRQTIQRQWGEERSALPTVNSRILIGIAVGEGGRGGGKEGRMEFRVFGRLLARSGSTMEQKRFAKAIAIPIFLNINMFFPSAPVTLK